MLMLRERILKDFGEKISKNLYKSQNSPEQKSETYWNINFWIPSSDKTSI